MMITPNQFFLMWCIVCAVFGLAVVQDFFHMRQYARRHESRRIPSSKERSKHEKTR